MFKNIYFINFDLVCSSSFYCFQGREVWDTMLNQTNIQNNNNKYYLIQLLKADSGNRYFLSNPFLIDNRWSSFLIVVLGIPFRRFLLICFIHKWTVNVISSLASPIHNDAFFRETIMQIVDVVLFSFSCIVLYPCSCYAEPTVEVIKF